MAQAEAEAAAAAEAADAATEAEAEIEDVAETAAGLAAGENLLDQWAAIKESEGWETPEPTAECRRSTSRPMLPSRRPAARPRPRRCWIVGPS